MTLPQKALAESPYTPRQLARKMARGQHLSPRQLDNRVAVIRRVLKHGGAGQEYANRLGHLLGIEATWLQLPTKCWPPSWR